MARRAPNLSPWATEVLEKIAEVAEDVERSRDDARDVEQKLYNLIEQAMHSGVTSAQILEVTNLFSPSRLYQIKLRQYSEERGGFGGREETCQHIAVYGSGPRENQCTKCHKYQNGN